MLITSVQIVQLRGKAMNFAEIVDQFATSRRVPAAAIRAAVSDPAAFVPKAVEVLERCAAGGMLSDAEENAIILLVHVLGEIGDRRAFDPLIGLLLALDRDTAEGLLGDTLTETVPGILMRLGGDNFAPIEEGCVNSDIYEFSRAAMLSAWTYFVLEGQIERDTALAFLSAFPERAKKAGFGKDDHGWYEWIETVANLNFRELLPVVEAILAEGYLGPDKLGFTAIRIEDIHSMLDDAGTTQDRDAWMKRNRYEPFVDALGELSTWYCYSEKYWREKRKRRNFDLDDGGAAFNYVATNDYRSVGRNDPCPCGSGKKYKKCCLQ